MLQLRNCICLRLKAVAKPYRIRSEHCHTGENLKNLLREPLPEHAPLKTMLNDAFLSISKSRI